MTSRVSTTALMLLFTVNMALPVYRVFAQEELKDPAPLAVKLSETVMPANKESMAKFTVELTVDENSAPDGLSPQSTPPAAAEVTGSVTFLDPSLKTELGPPLSQPDVFLGESFPAPPPPPGSLSLERRLDSEMGIVPSEPQGRGDPYRPVIPGSIPNAKALEIIDEEMLGGELLGLSGSGEALLPALALPSAAMAAGSQQSVPSFKGVIESLSTKYTMELPSAAPRSLQPVPTQGIQGQKAAPITKTIKTLQ